MAQKIIDTSLPNDGEGDELRTAFNDTNDNFTELYDTKENKVTGKGLSTNDFTDDFETKLDDFDPLANANVQVDWTQQDNQQDDYIKNKPLQTDAISESKQHIAFSFPLNDKTDLDSLHGTFLMNGSESGQILNSGTSITGVGGVSKVMMVVLAGSDVVGNILISGTSVDRVTAVETIGDTELVSINGLSTDNSTTDSNGNIIHDYIDNYISNKFWRGSLTFSTTDLDITNIKFAQVAFEQFDDVTDLTISSFDATYKISNDNAVMDAYLYAVTVLGNKSSITKIAELHHASGEEVDAVYRRKQKELDVQMNGEVSGVFVDLYLLPTNFEYFSNFVIKVWATLKLPSTLFVDGNIAGVRRYDELEDVEQSRNGKAGHVVAVNATETGLEYIPAASADLSTVVPYTGAAGSVDLGSNDLTASSLNSVITRVDKLLVLGTGQGANMGIGNSVPTSDEIKFAPTYQGSNPPFPDELIWQYGSGWRFEGGLEVQSLNITTLPVFADDTAAASLDQGDVYRTATGELRIKL